MTIFWTLNDFVDSTNKGFLRISEDTYKVRMENGNVVDHKIGDGKITEDMENFLTTLVNDYAFMWDPTDYVTLDEWETPVQA